MFLKSLVLGAALFFSISVNAEVVEEVITLPVTVKNIYGGEFTQDIVVTIFRDSSRASSPWLVLNHGRSTSGAHKMGRQRYVNNSKYFVEKGFVVLIPTRVGYGPSGGPDVEYSGACGQNNYPVVYQAAVDQVSAVIDYAKKLPYIESSRGLVVGQSYGGMTSIATSTIHKEGLKGVVNFAGGGGGNPENRPRDPCGADLLKKTYKEYGEKSKVPSLWLYSINDKFWGEAYPREWFDSFKVGAEKNNVLTKFISLPPYKEDGHSIFTGNPEAWRSEVNRFFNELGF